jgi:cytochrome b6-f complex iron-sulfur subunit
MSRDSSSRRRFLEVVAHGSVLVGAACLGAGCSASTPEPTGLIAAGNVSALPVGSLKVVPGSPLAIGRDAQGVYAMTLVCTHAGCDIASEGAVSAQRITCFCHGSQFDANGAVLQGPASAPLEHFAVTISSAGEITVDADRTVDATVRVAVA